MAAKTSPSGTLPGGELYLTKTIRAGMVLSDRLSSDICPNLIQKTQHHEPCVYFIRRIITQSPVHAPSKNQSCEAQSKSGQEDDSAGRDHASSSQ